jgi:enoyl-CoA hydratase/carnithine racemase
VTGTLATERRGDVLVARIDREARRNALDTATVRSLRDALDAAAVDATVRAIVLASTGTTSFCAGQDVKEMELLDTDQRLAATVAGQRLMEEIEQHPCPVIAAIEGYCLGGGLELALSCDARVAGRNSTFGLPEVARDLLPTWGGHYRLARVIGSGRAKAVGLFGLRLEADEALAAGLLLEIVDAGRASERAIEIASGSCEANSRRTVATAKMLFTTGPTVDPRIARQLDELAEAGQAWR